jgi:hypothetical protein
MQFGPQEELHAIHDTPNVSFLLHIEAEDVLM